MTTAGAADVAPLPWNLDRPRVVVLPDVLHGVGRRDTVEDCQAGQRRTCPAVATAAGHLDPRRGRLALQVQPELGTDTLNSAAT